LGSSSLGSSPLVSSPLVSSPLVSFDKNDKKKTTSWGRSIIKKKHTLGKNKLGTKHVLSVLIPDQKTRKKRIEAQNDLRRKSIKDVKSYLRKKGLISSGSVAPNELLRKMYESAVMSGVNTTETDSLHLK
jgi:hypothetical protein